MLIDCLQNPSLQGSEKFVWVLVILFLHVLGALIYFFVGRSRGPVGRPAQTGRDRWPSFHRTPRFIAWGA
jgi:hypothetical protein